MANRNPLKIGDKFKLVGRANVFTIVRIECKDGAFGPQLVGQDANYQTKVLAMHEGYTFERVAACETVEYQTGAHAAGDTEVMRETTAQLYAGQHLARGATMHREEKIGFFMARSTLTPAEKIRRYVDPGFSLGANAFRLDTGIEV